MFSGAWSQGGSFASATNQDGSVIRFAQTFAEKSIWGCGSAAHKAGHLFPFRPQGESSSWRCFGLASERKGEISPMRRNDKKSSAENVG